MNSPTASSKRTLRAVINRGVCCGYGVCAEICPQVFQVDDNGLVTLVTESVPAELEEKAREAVAACPLSALDIREE